MLAAFRTRVFAQRSFFNEPTAIFDLLQRINLYQNVLFLS